MFNLSRTHHMISVVGALFLCACGDDSAPSDAGIDVFDASSDQGTDAPSDSGPDAFDGGVDAPFATFDAGAATFPFDSLCTPGEEAPEYPEPSAWPPNRGPGISTQSFDPSELYTHCAYLDGGEMDVSDHHNLLTMYDGYLLMPWAPEWGGGGLTFFDISDACSPEVHSVGYSPTMRETHTVGFMHEDGAWAVTASIGGILAVGEGGIEFWDVADTSAPSRVSELHFPGFFYPDAYGRIVMSQFWQAPFVYVGSGFNGIYIVDATDPRAPQLAAQYNFEPPIRVGQVQAVGDLLIVTAAGGTRTALLDISDPLTPRPIPGGDFQAVDSDGIPREAYFTNFSGGIIYYARKDEGGGIVTMDIRDPSAPVPSGDLNVDGSGGYVFTHHDRAFVGMGRRAAIFDISDLSAIEELAELDLEGDLDTFTPIGHLGLLSVDADAVENQGTALAPIASAPDARPPVVNFVWPPAGATGRATSSRIGVTLDELVDARSAFAGSVRLYETESGYRVPGIVSAQEAFVNFFPRCALRPGTSYTLEIPAGGLTDLAGNATEERFTSTFETAP